ncbi:MAG: hypothetical protein KGO96_10530 [Elusimicrobia bacterium]|nr:hypothetical protein [Elusimicrobiota bacterium]
MIPLNTNDPNGNPWRPGGAQEMALHALGANAIAWPANEPPQTDVEVNLSGYAAALAAAEATLATAAAQAQYATLLAGGLAITSTGTPALDGTYATDQQSEFNVVALQAAITVNAANFPGYYRLKNGARVTMTAAQFTAIAAALLTFVEAADEAVATAAQGGTPTWPAATATVA